MPTPRRIAWHANAPYVRIGTSGWHYKHWRGPFYPEKMPPRAYLQYYMERLNTVEINNSFYMQPSIDSVASWAEQVPDDFLFAYKAHRFITHMKKLSDARDPLRRLYGVVEALGEKVAAILFQLPPSWKVNEDRLEEFLGLLSPRYRHAFEFRNPTWFNDRVLALLEQHGQSLCIFDIGGNVSPLETTSDLVYVRLHGPQPGYKGLYPHRTLELWEQRFEKWHEEGRDVLCFFDNDDSGYAVENAIQLRSMVSSKFELPVL